MHAATANSGWFGGSCDPLRPDAAAGLREIPPQDVQRTENEEPQGSQQPQSEQRDGELGQASLHMELDGGRPDPNLGITIQFDL